MAVAFISIYFTEIICNRVLYIFLIDALVLEKCPCIMHNFLHVYMYECGSVSFVSACKNVYRNLHWAMCSVMCGMPSMHDFWSVTWYSWWLDCMAAKKNISRIVIIVFVRRGGPKSAKAGLSWYCRDLTFGGQQWFSKLCGNFQNIPPFPCPPCWRTLALLMCSSSTPYKHWSATANWARKISKQWMMFVIAMILGNVLPEFYLSRIALWNCL